MDSIDKLEGAIVLARGALLTITHMRLQPSVVISNDWVAALTAPYARHVNWAGGRLREPHRCLFIHLVHNLEPGYDPTVSPP